MLPCVDAWKPTQVRTLSTAVRWLLFNTNTASPAPLALFLEKKMLFPPVGFSQLNGYDLFFPWGYAYEWLSVEKSQKKRRSSDWYYGKTENTGAVWREFKMYYFISQKVNSKKNNSQIVIGKVFNVGYFHSLSGILRWSHVTRDLSHVKFIWEKQTLLSFSVPRFSPVNNKAHILMSSKPTGMQIVLCFHLSQPNWFHSH